MDSTEVVRAYGCVKCQTHHYEGEPLFQPHIYHQSKHGIERRPRYTDERFAEIMRNDMGPARCGASMAQNPTMGYWACSVHGPGCTSR